MRSICGVFPMGCPSRNTLPQGIALIERRPGSTSADAPLRAGRGAGVTGGGSTAGAVARCGGDSTRRGGAARGDDGGGDDISVSRPALDGGGTADTSGAGSRAAGEGWTAGGGSERGLVGGGVGAAGIDEMPSHAAPPPPTITRPARTAPIRRPRRLARGSVSESRITTGPLPRVFRGFVLNQAFRPSGRAVSPPSAATKSRTFENRSAGRLLIARRSACETARGSLAPPSSGGSPAPRRPSRGGDPVRHSWTTAARAG